MENSKDSVRSKGPHSKVPSLKRMQSIILNETRYVTQKPAMYNIALIGDETTPADYIAQALEQHFYKKPEEVAASMLALDQNGEIICGKFTREYAETKIAAIIEDARHANYPLKCVMRKVKDK